MRSNKASLIVAGLMAGLGVGGLGGLPFGGATRKPKTTARSSVSKEEQERRIAAAQAKRERKNAARLKSAGGSHA